MSFTMMQTFTAANYTANIRPNGICHIAYCVHKLNTRLLFSHSFSNPRENLLSKMNGHNNERLFLLFQILVYGNRKILRALLNSGLFIFMCCVHLFTPFFSHCFYFICMSASESSKG